jgi:hypothetical protein
MELTLSHVNVQVENHVDRWGAKWETPRFGRP